MRTASGSVILVCNGTSILPMSTVPAFHIIHAFLCADERVAFLRWDD